MGTKLGMMAAGMVAAGIVVVINTATVDNNDDVGYANLKRSGVNILQPQKHQHKDKSMSTKTNGKRRMIRSRRK